MAKARESAKPGKNAGPAKAAAKKASRKTTKKPAAKPGPSAAKKSGSEKPARPAGAKGAKRSEKTAPVAAAKEQVRASTPVQAARAEPTAGPATGPEPVVKPVTSETPPAAERPQPQPSRVQADIERRAASTPSAATAADRPSAAPTEEPPELLPEAEAEPVSELEGVRLPATRGKVGVFGGPKDHSAKPDDKLALPTGRHSQYERIRSLDARGYYCAMRWDYRQKHMSPEEGKRWWANKKILITNPANGKSAVVRAVDYGPHESTGLAISISPGAADAVGVSVGDEINMVFADQKSPLGPVVGD